MNVCLSPDYVVSCWGVVEALVGIPVPAAEGGGDVMTSAAIGVSSVGPHTQQQPLVVAESSSPITAERMLAAQQMLEGLLSMLKSTATAPPGTGGATTSHPPLSPHCKEVVETATRCRLAKLLLTSAVASEAARKVIEPATAAALKGTLQPSDGCSSRAAATTTPPPSSSGSHPLITTAGGPSLVDLFELRLDVLRSAIAVHRRKGMFDKSLALVAATSALLPATPSAAVAAAPTTAIVHLKVDAARAILLSEKCRVYYSMTVLSTFSNVDAMRSLVDCADFSQFHASLAALQGIALETMKEEKQKEKKEKNPPPPPPSTDGAEGLDHVIAASCWSPHETEMALRSAIAAIATLKVLCLISMSRFASARRELNTAVVLFGDTMPEMRFLSIFLSGVAEGGSSSSGPSPSAGGTTPQIPAAGPGAPTSMSSKTLTSLFALTELMHKAANSQYDASVKLYNNIATIVEDRMRELNDVGNIGKMLQSQLNSEIRCLTGIKIVASSQLFFLDLNTLNLCAAASKLHPLTQYMTLFYRHTGHYRCDMHLLIALLGTLLHRPEEALEHVDVAGSCCCGEGEQLQVLLVKAELCYHNRQQLRFSQLFNDTMVQYLEVYGDPTSDGDSTALTLTSSSAARKSNVSTPTVKIEDEKKVSSNADLRDVLGLKGRIAGAVMVGAYLLEERDYIGAISQLRWAAETAKKFVGVSCPALGQAMRLLTTAYEQSGEAEKCEVTAAAAAQLAAKCGDELSVASCALWVLRHTTVVNAEDRRRQAGLHTTVDRIHDFYEAQLSAANDETNITSRDVEYVMKFLPGKSTEYAEWLAKSSSAKKGRSGPSNGSKRSRE